MKGFNIAATWRLHVLQFELIQMFKLQWEQGTRMQQIPFILQT